MDMVLPFLAATFLFAYMPGPALLYATAQTIARGRRAGVFAALGIHVGGYAHVLAAALGLAALFTAVPVLYVALKLAGTAYLIWLGVHMIRASVSQGRMVQADIPSSQPAPRRAFWQSVSVEVLNPKTALFYIAFLPQFTDPSAALPLACQLLGLGIIVNVIFSSADLVAVFCADRLAQTLKQSAAMTRWLQRLGGSILVALGLKLAWDRG